MIRSARVSRLREAFVSVLFVASLVALAMLVLGTLSGATDIAREYAAQMETQVREHLWLALLANPLAWVSLLSAVSMSAIAASLAGYLVLLLNRDS